MKTMPKVDVAIVGGGFLGLQMARELSARAHLSVAVLERGPARSVEGKIESMDELDHKGRLNHVQSYAHETLTLRHTPRGVAAPLRVPASLYPGTGTGGMGEHWGGTCPRYMPDFFELKTKTLEKYGKQRIPENCTMQDIGLTWNDMEPLYTRAEKLLGISGKAGNINGKLIAGGNIFEGPRSEEYPTPPMKLANFPTNFAAAVEKLGYHPFPNPAATNSVAWTNPDGVSRPGCMYCGFCDGYPCMMQAKAQPTNVFLPLLKDDKRVKLRNGAWVRRIVHQGTGRQRKATGVMYRDMSDTHQEDIFQPAQIVILASWVMNNVRLLALSGLGEQYDPHTGTGTLGRNLTCHINIVSAQIFVDKPMNRFMGAASSGIRLGDLDGDVFDHSNLPFLRGGNFGAMGSGYQPITTFGTIPTSPDRKERNWGSAWKKKSIDHYDRWGFINFAGEHLPYRDNYLDLDPTYKDVFGDPLLRLTLNWNKNEHDMIAWSIDKSLEMAKAMDAVAANPFVPYTDFDLTRLSMTHTQGGAMMGASPAESFVNTYQQSWETDNLFVVGNSALPQQGSSNPTLTLLGLCYRTADAIVDRYVKSPGPLA